jgi:hypothetical protein
VSVIQLVAESAVRNTNRKVSWFNAPAFSDEGNSTIDIIGSGRAWVFGSVLVVNMCPAVTESFAPFAELFP